MYVDSSFTFISVLLHFCSVSLLFLRCFFWFSVDPALQSTFKHVTHPSYVLAELQRYDLIA
jgi:hypothetical protein